MSGASNPIETGADIQPFRIEVSQVDLDDLHDRLACTRWPDELPGVRVLGTDLIVGSARPEKAGSAASDITVADGNKYRGSVSGEDG